MNRFLSGAILIILSCTSQKQGDRLPLHMVLDAGSSGTRICLFGVSRKDNRCRAFDTTFGCKDVPASGGLADQGAAAKATVEKALAMVSTEDLRRVQAAALLGTGGFRRLPEARQKTVLGFAGEAFQSTSFSASMKVLSGEDEGTLAWAALAERTGSDAHAIVEIGGATVQIAAGRRGNLRAISTKDGMNDAAKILTEQSACFTSRGDACRADVRTRVFSSSALGGFSASLNAEQKQLPLYGLGAPWNAVFARARTSELSLADLEKQTAGVCSQPVENLKSSMPEEHARRACYLHSYALELLAVTGFSRIRQGGESWPRGAAVSGQYFSACR
jgi:hypothetical protein